MRRSHITIIYCKLLNKCVNVNMLKRQNCLLTSLHALISGRLWKYCKLNVEQRFYENQQRLYRLKNRARKRYKPPWATEILVPHKLQCALVLPDDTLLKQVNFLASSSLSVHFGFGMSKKVICAFLRGARKQYVKLTAATDYANVHTDTYLSAHTLMHLKLCTSALAPNSWTKIGLWLSRAF